MTAAIHQAAQLAVLHIQREPQTVGVKADRTLQGVGHALHVGCLGQRHGNAFVLAGADVRRMHDRDGPGDLIQLGVELQAERVTIDLEAGELGRRRDHHVHAGGGKLPRRCQAARRPKAPRPAASSDPWILSPHRARRATTVDRPDLYTPSPSPSPSRCGVLMIRRDHQLCDYATSPARGDHCAPPRAITASSCRRAASAARRDLASMTQSATAAW